MVERSSRNLRVFGEVSLVCLAYRASNRRLRFVTWLLSFGSMWYFLSSYSCIQSVCCFALLMCPVNRKLSELLRPCVAFLSSLNVSSST
ncbi:Protein of unknown function [Pyronema omphalodes CBS 100304]|uniref:Uncharacterized protein n=1 Tax=Pyronema omphalodes (strain CBS 100304) TaxID=1076935 RepID=U4LG15_PYROM|nr:Protein of unknown function [Pyronema omphalodes CBS 100304]